MPDSGNYIKWGTANAWCDVCGQRYKLSDLRKRWDNLMACPGDFELDHPQKYIKVPPENISLPDIRPRPDYYNTPYVCTMEGSLGLADIGEADCARADISTPTPLPYYGPLNSTAIVGYAAVGKAIVGSINVL